MLRYLFLLDIHLTSFILVLAQAFLLSCLPKLKLLMPVIGKSIYKM